jgi:hypothetical protein
MSCSVRQPLIDIFISRQMEHEKGKNFNSMVQDTVYRLQHCMQLLDKVTLFLYKQSKLDYNVSF